MNKNIEAFYYARRKTLQIVVPGVSGIPTVKYLNMEGKKAAREYCKQNGITAKF